MTQQASMPPARPLRETPDLASSTDDYASRFAGPAGEYLLAVQNHGVLRLARPWLGGNVLDVGGGHAQLCGPLLDAGCKVTVLGSAAGCFERPRRYFGTRVRCVEGDLLQPPFSDGSFDFVVSVRMLAHIDDSSGFTAALCRVARHAVIVDYPDFRSVNAITPLVFGWKKRLEGNTRSYRLYRRREVANLFAGQGFGKSAIIGQFFWPMVMHRKLGWPAGSKLLEVVPRALHLTGLFGSPILFRAIRT